MNLVQKVEQAIAEAKTPTDKAWAALAAVQAHNRIDGSPTPSSADNALREAAKAIQMLKRSIMIDVGSCHANRGPGASSEMRSDDREMRRDMEKAFALIDAALSQPAAEAEPGDDREAIALVLENSVINFGGIAQTEIGTKAAALIRSTPTAQQARQWDGHRCGSCGKRLTVDSPPCDCRGTPPGFAAQQAAGEAEADTTCMKLDFKMMREALYGIADDWMSSKNHHEGWVLIPVDKFSRLRVADRIMKMREYDPCLATPQPTETQRIVAWLMRHFDGELSNNQHVQRAAKSFADGIIRGEHLAGEGE